MGQALHQISKQLNTVQNSCYVVLGDSLNIVVHGISEPFMNEVKQRERAARQHSASKGGNTGACSHQTSTTLGKMTRRKQLERPGPTANTG